jgi:phage gpG-like protein
MPGADGSYTPGEAAAKMAARIRNITNLKPLMDAQAKLFQSATDAAFKAQRSPAGESWPKLAQSTLDARKRAAKGGKSRDTLGRFTGNAALYRTGTMRRTTKYVGDVSTVRLQTVDYMTPHQVGNAQGRPPKRNPLVYERAGGQLVLAPQFARQFRDAFIAYVETGKVA